MAALIAAALLAVWAAPAAAQPAPFYSFLQIGTSSSSSDVVADGVVSA
jgi:long-subunit fatty acid transport protein